MSPRTLLFVLLGLVAVAGSSLSCRETSPRATHSQKLVVIGFDGLDRDLIRQWASEGKLPTFARLIDQGTLAELDTTHSPESPTACRPRAEPILGPHQPALQKWMPRARIRPPGRFLACFDGVVTWRTTGGTFRYRVAEKLHLRHLDAALLVAQLKGRRSDLPPDRGGDRILLLAPPRPPATNHDSCAIHRFEDPAAVVRRSEVRPRRDGRVVGCRETASPRPKRR